MQGLRGQVGSAVFPQPGGEGGEAGGQVAAVHGGDIARLHGPQRAYIVPVIEVPAPLRQRVTGAQHVLYQPQRALPRRRAQVQGGEGADHGQADIRRRGALGGPHGRLLLIVVRREEAALGCAHLVKITPDLGTFTEQEAPVLPREGLGKGQIGAQRQREEGPHQPDYAHRLPHRLRGEEDERRAQGQLRPCRGQEGAQPAGHSLRRGLPLQQAPVRDRHPPERRGRGGQVRPGLPGQEHQPEHHLTHAQRHAV